jgi:hypothetical protein
VDVKLSCQGILSDSEILMPDRAGRGTPSKPAEWIAIKRYAGFSRQDTRWRRLC